ncbi:MAG: hypothetical protein AN490_03870 [Anabaena sp. AL09]|nr:MAG: hypothetical protein AN490_03870 [Anabaena sp. AL09]
MLGCDSEALRRNHLKLGLCAIAKRSVGIAVWGCWECDSVSAAASSSFKIRGLCAIAKREIGIAVWGCWGAIMIFCLNQDNQD